MLRRATIQDLHKIVYVFNESMEDMEEHGYDKLDYLGEDTFRDGIENGYIYVRGIGTDIGGFIFISINEILNSSHIKWSKNITGTSFHSITINKNYKDRGIEEELIFLAEDISRKYRLNYVRGCIYELNTDTIRAVEKFNYRFVGDIHKENMKYFFRCYEKLL